VPNDWSIEAADFANKLIRRKPVNRLGYANGISELKNHYWFQGFDWESFNNKTLKAPWMPPKGDNFKGKQVEFVGEDEKVMQEAERLIRRDSVQKLFEGYHYSVQPKKEIQQPVP
jgi:hypothetical protein